MESDTAPVDPRRDAVAHLQRSYKRTFSEIDAPRSDAAAVLRDLARFCRANESTFHPDPHVASKLDGRREVWLHIQKKLRLTEEELWSLFIGRQAGA